MSYHLDHMFPEYAVDIEALSKMNKDFETLLGDYEELSTWIVVRKTGKPGKAEEITRAQELLEELEKEILSKLKVQA